MNRRELTIITFFLALAIIFVVSLLELGAIQFLAELAMRFS